MNEPNEFVGPLDRLTPELAGEVRRNLMVWSAITAGVVAAMCGVVVVAADPSMGGFAGGLAATLMVTFLAASIPVAGLLLALVYLFGCWPALIRRQVIRERFGVAAEAVSAQARRRLAGERGLWASAGRGAVVGLAFAEAGVLAGRAISGKWLFIGPAAILVVMAANLASQAWLVRRAASEKAAFGGRGIAGPGEAAGRALGS